jgi:argininosuccinate lyase
MKNKKGQEEMVGFVVIVVLVAIVFLILFGLFVGRENNVGKESREVYIFLDSLMEYTTECAVSFEPAYSNFGELLTECYEKRKCTSEKEACEVLEETAKEILNSSFLVSQESRIKGYEFESYYGNNESQEDILYLSEGNCSGSLRGAEYLSPAFPGTVTTSLKICF